MDITQLVDATFFQGPRATCHQDVLSSILRNDKDAYQTRLRIKQALFVVAYEMLIFFAGEDLVHEMSGGFSSLAHGSSHVLEEATKLAEGTRNNSDASPTMPTGHAHKKVLTFPPAFHFGFWPQPNDLRSYGRSSTPRKQYY